MAHATHRTGYHEANSVHCATCQKPAAEHRPPLARLFKCSHCDQRWYGSQECHFWKGCPNPTDTSAISNIQSAALAALFPTVAEDEIWRELRERNQAQHISPKNFEQLVSLLTPNSLQCAIATDKGTLLQLSTFFPAQ